jgi:SPP1 family predicted phage head-tail adaptor
MTEYRAADLDQRVTFRREITTPDGMGGADHSFVDIVTVWAHVRPLSGREREQAQRLNAEADYLIVIRDRDDVDETDVAVWDGSTFNIRFARNRARSRWLEIEAARGVVS